MTTFAAIVEDPRERLEMIRGWTKLPDLVAANQGDEGIDEISELLSARGVGVEACVLGVGDTEQSRSCAMRLDSFD
ncbi:hypothetical protein HQ312_18490 [Rhodococcus sp. BP-316]|uniref:hypothetical protein n=1 Tax=Rhodococcus sp. BP-316 TaxID=2739445 RepID=UPI001C9B3CC5|nr:hypothetical protein [Rhodococcus sp. BP-316]MBY6683048.1 hypothetical protein [Rhodococcus sp. BP-316]